MGSIEAGGDLGQVTFRHRISPLAERNRPASDSAGRISLCGYVLEGTHLICRPSAELWSELFFDALMWKPLLIAPRALSPLPKALASAAMAW